MSRNRRKEKSNGRGRPRATDKINSYEDRVMDAIAQIDLASKQLAESKKSLINACLLMEEEKGRVNLHARLNKLERG